LYLPSKKIKYIAFFVLIALLVLSAFGGAIKNLALSLSQSFLSLSNSSHQREISRFEKENLDCQLKLKQYKRLAKENKILREALNFKNKDNLGLVGSEIIAFSPSSWHQYIFLNVGENEAISQNMLVVDKDGNLVGKVKEVYADRSKVILIRNPDFQTPVSIDNRILGLLQGNLSGVEILYVEESNQINLSEPIYAALSPFTSIVKVGKISRIKKAKDSFFYEIEVDISAQDKLPQVLFIVK